MAEQGTYYIPGPSHWPLTASIGLFITAVGAASWLHASWYGPYLVFIGSIILIYMFFGWFGEVVHENQAGLYDEQVDRTYRWSMGWFIFSEVFFFAAFFGALFYARFWSIPVLGGEHGSPLTHELLWPSFKAVWPMLQNPNSEVFENVRHAMGAWGVPAINTLILLTSGATLTWAHWGINKQNRKQIIIGLALTVLLGIIFLIMQASEYYEAYHHLGLKISSGMYGTTFFMLTGFHGAHVTLGTIMLIVMLVRAMLGHFTPDDHFAFEGVAWYWHFVDVVWLLLFVVVYWL